MLRSSVPPQLTYTFNSQTSFTNRLAHPIDMVSSSYWEIGLAEIMYKPPTLSVIQCALIDVISSLNVLIFCDLVSPQLVGSDLKRKIICPSKLGKHMFENIYYLPVDKKEFTSILLNQETVIAYFDTDTAIPTKVVTL